MEHIKPVNDGYTIEYRNVLEEIGKAEENSGFETYYTRQTARLPIDDFLFLEQPHTLKILGVNTHVVFLRYKNGAYFFIDMKFSDYLKYIGRGTEQNFNKTKLDKIKKSELSNVNIQ